MRHTTSSGRPAAGWPASRPSWARRAADVGPRQTFGWWPRRLSRTSGNTAGTAVVALGIGASLLRRWEVCDGLGVYVMGELKMFAARMQVLGDVMIGLAKRAEKEGEIVASASMIAALAKLAEVEFGVRKFLVEHER